MDILKVFTSLFVCPSISAQGFQERICYLSQELPQKREHILGMRKQLLDEKNNALSAIKEYESKHSSVMNKLKEVFLRNTFAFLHFFFNMGMFTCIFCFVLIVLLH